MPSRGKGISPNHFIRLFRTSSARPALTLTLDSRRHVHHVKPQQPRGVTSPTSHNGEIQGSSDRPIDVGIFPHMTAKQGAQRGQSEACPPLLPRNCRSSATSAPRTSRSTRWRDALLARSRSIAALPGVALLSRRRRHRSDQSSPPHSAKRRQSRQACRVGRQSGCCGSYGRHFCFGTACDRWRARRMPCDRQKQASRYDWSCNRASGPSAALRSGRSGRRARCAGRSCVGRLGGSR